eukprot:g9266.t1
MAGLQSEVAVGSGGNGATDLVRPPRAEQPKGVNILHLLLQQDKTDDNAGAAGGGSVGATGKLPCSDSSGSFCPAPLDPSSFCDDDTASNLRRAIFRSDWTPVQDFLTEVHRREPSCKKKIFDGVREAVEDLKLEADDLKRIVIDKKHLERKNHYTNVRPAFQYAQNKTHIFVLLKMSARWNAPGALKLIHGPGGSGSAGGANNKPPFPELDLGSSMPSSIAPGTPGSSSWAPSSTTSLNFTAFGQISASKYKYFLSLNLWDALYSATVALNSVGKFLLTGEKQHRGWWKTLEAEQQESERTSTSTTSTVQLWNERQEQENTKAGIAADSSATAGVLSTSHLRKWSPGSCAADKEKPGSAYCRVRDACVMHCAVSCVEGLDQVRSAECVGPPILDAAQDRPKIRFQDTDSRRKRFTGWATVRRSRLFGADSLFLVSVDADWGSIDRIDVFAGTGSSFSTTRDSPKFRLDDVYIRSGDLELRGYNAFGASPRPLHIPLEDGPHYPNRRASSLRCVDASEKTGHLMLNCELELFTEDNEIVKRKKGDEYYLFMEELIAIQHYDLRFGFDDDRSETTETSSAMEVYHDAAFHEDSSEWRIQEPADVRVWRMAQTRVHEIPPSNKGRDHRATGRQMNEAPTHVIAIPRTMHGAGPEWTWLSWKIADVAAEGAAEENKTNTKSEL